MTAVKDDMTTDFESLVRQHQAGIWRYLRYLGASNVEADDLTQETFLAVYRGNFEHRSAAASSTYLRKAARNQLLMLRRRVGRELNTVQLDIAETVWAGTERDDGLSGFLGELGNCVEKLEGKSRQAIDWFYKHGLGRDEIASRLEMKPNGIKTLLRRSRQVLRDCVERGIRNDG